MKLNSLVEKGNPERVAGGFKYTEGPVWHPAGYLLFSDLQGNRIYRWSAEKGVEVWREPSNHSNGLALDRQGRLVACERSGRRVSRTEADGTVVALADQYDGKPLCSPSDLVVKSDGSVYFTDPFAFRVPKEQQSQPCESLYRIAPDGVVARLADDLARPNGLAFSPDESVLYVVDEGHGWLLAYRVQADGTLTEKRIFAEMDHPQNGFNSNGPDGVKVDLTGNVYVSGADGIWVYDVQGDFLGVLMTRSDQRHAEAPSNLAFGDADRKSLYVTACSSVYRFRMKIAGAT